MIHSWSLPQLPAARLPGNFSALERVVVEQGEDSAVVWQQTPRYVDHPLALLIGLYEKMEKGCWQNEVNVENLQKAADRKSEEKRYKIQLITKAERQKSVRSIKGTSAEDRRAD